MGEPFQVFWRRSSDDAQARRQVKAKIRHAIVERARHGGWLRWYHAVDKHALTSARVPGEQCSFQERFVAREGSPAYVGASRDIISWMPKAKIKPKTKRKKVVTPAFKRQIEQARRDLAQGKGITVGELLTRLLERDARRHAA